MLRALNITLQRAFSSASVISSDVKCTSIHKEKITLIRKDNFSHGHQMENNIYYYKLLEMEKLCLVERLLVIELMKYKGKHMSNYLSLLK
jgi:hypothetical protein